MAALSTHAPPRDRPDPLLVARAATPSAMTSPMALRAERRHDDGRLPHAILFQHEGTAPRHAGAPRTHSPTRTRGMQSNLPERERKAAKPHTNRTAVTARAGTIHPQECVAPGASLILETRSGAWLRALRLHWDSCADVSRPRPRTPSLRLPRHSSPAHLPDQPS